MMHRWIALTALYEDLLSRIAHEIYKVYKKNQIFDDTLLDLCRHMDELFLEGRRHEEELEQGLGQFSRRNKLTSFFSSHFVRWNLFSYRRALGDKILEVGLRGMYLYGQRASFTDNRGVKGLCKRAARYREDADKVWQDMVEMNRNRSQVREPQTPLEYVVIYTHRLSRKVLANRTLRRVLGGAMGYDDEVARAVVEQDYSSSSQPPAPNSGGPGAGGGGS